MERHISSDIKTLEFKPQWTECECFGYWVTKSASFWNVSCDDHFVVVLLDFEISSDWPLRDVTILWIIMFTYCDQSVQEFSGWKFISNLIPTPQCAARKKKDETFKTDPKKITDKLSRKLSEVQTADLLLVTGCEEPAGVLTQLTFQMKLLQQYNQGTTLHWALVGC